MSWQCPSCGNRNPNSTLACEKCHKVDLSASPAEIAAWKKALRDESIGQRERALWQALYIVVCLVVIGQAALALIQYRGLVGSANLYHACIEPAPSSGEAPPGNGVVAMRVAGLHRDSLYLRRYRMLGGTRVVSYSYKLETAAGVIYHTRVTNLPGNVYRAPYRWGEDIEAEVWDGRVVRIFGMRSPINTDDYPDTRVEDQIPEMIVSMLLVVVVLCFARRVFGSGKSGRRELGIGQ